MRKKPQWITGKVLKVLVALRGIEAGDEIIMKYCHEKTVDGDRELDHAHPDDRFHVNKVCRVDSMDDHPAWPINVSVVSSEAPYSACYCCIRAWRRPCPKG